VSRNIVLVTYDSLRADHCSFMGYERATTPTLDAVADEGVVFENAVASGVPTVASMTAVMTGEHSLASPEVGRTDEQRAQVTGRRTVAEVLSEAGYATGALSPNPPASSYFGFDAGFDWFEDFLADDRGLTERVWNRVFQQSIEGNELATYLRLARNVLTRDEVLRPWEDFYEEILAWRERVTEPYFLWVLLLEPHHPWMPPTGSQRWSSRLDKYRAFQQYARMFTHGWQPEFSAAEQQRLVDLYDDSIRYGDRFLARLRADLEDDDPVFLVHADHGEEFGARGRYGHQPFLTEELVHVPLVVDGLDRSGRVSRPVALRQLAPTLATLADAPDPFAGPGLFEEPARPWVTSKVFAQGRRRAAVRTERGKYVAEPGREALYDLATDRDERENLAGAAPEAATAFADALALHVRTERDKRAIDGATAALATEGRV